MNTPTEPLLDMFRQHSDDELLLCYRGDFHDILTAHILEISRQNSVTKGDDLKLGKRMSLLLVECFQNIVRHGRNEMQVAQTTSHSFLCLRKKGSIYFVNTINPIEKKSSANLDHVLKTINTLDNASLKKEYLERLENNEWSEQGGAGLGLLEMARKSSSKILHCFVPLNETHDLLQLQITIDGPEAQQQCEVNWLDDCAVLFNSMSSDRSILKYKGEISQHILIQFIEISKNTFRQNAGRTKETKALIHTLIELLQNISKHGGEEGHISEGYLIIGQVNNNRFAVNAGNVISDKKMAVLKEKLRYLSQLSLHELAELHRKVLAASLKFESKINTGLGLIEIFMASKNKINYRIESVNNTPFFGISVAV